MAKLASKFGVFGALAWAMCICLFAIVSACVGVFLAWLAVNVWWYTDVADIIPALVNWIEHWKNING